MEGRDVFKYAFLDSLAGSSGLPDRRLNEAFYSHTLGSIHFLLTLPVPHREISSLLPWGYVLPTSISQPRICELLPLALGSVLLNNTAQLWDLLYKTAGCLKDGVQVGTFSPNFTVKKKKDIRHLNNVCIDFMLE